MIDELTLLKEMLGDLTNAGIWGICIYVSYKLIIFGGAAGSVVYVVRLVVTSIYKHMQSDFTKAQAEELRRRSDNDVKRATEIMERHGEREAEAIRECNEVKSMYKILKMKAEAEDVSKPDV